MKKELNGASVQPLAVPVMEAARMLSLGRTSIYELLKSGLLERCSILTRTLVTTASIHRLIESSTANVEDR